MSKMRTRHFSQLKMKSRIIILEIDKIGLQKESAHVLNVKSLSPTLMDEIRSLIQSFRIKKFGAVAFFRNHQHRIL